MKRESESVREKGVVVGGVAWAARRREEGERGASVLCRMSGQQETKHTEQITEQIKQSRSNDNNNTAPCMHIRCHERSAVYAHTLSPTQRAGAINTAPCVCETHSAL